MSEDSLHTKVAILEREINQYNQLIDKFDQTIDRLSEVSNSLKNLVVVHEQRLTQQEKKTEEIVEKMNDEIKSLVEMLKDLAVKEDSHFRDLSDRMHAIEKWKWTVIGGAVAAAALVTKLDVGNLFSVFVAH
jgi:glutathionylspermidine synthase